tara:strand:- start:2116 stop:3252 length:1137 start_codon:yes stop_codon:yes gene_type:complete
MKEYDFINESITATQKVQFIIDSSNDLEGLNRINFTSYDSGIIFCDKHLQDSWYPEILKKLAPFLKIKNVNFLDASEETKGIESYVTLVNFLGNEKCTKNDVIIAIGGGTILDVVSFLSSVFMRGIPLIMIPTTIIGQADASTAGKTCINTSYAKNILGTLYLPEFVYNNVQILKTNTQYENRQGFSEIFKYGLLGSTDLINLQIEYINKQSDNLMMKILSETIKVRMKIRKKDPLASNLGHTFGHAIEKITNYEVNHGDAISVGIVMALEFSYLEGIIEKRIKNKIIEMMETLRLNTKVSDNIDPGLLTKIMLTDKKSTNSHIRLVLINEIGKPYVNDESYFYPVKPEKMEIFLLRFFDKSKYVAKNHWNTLRLNGI